MGKGLVALSFVSIVLAAGVDACTGHDADPGGAPSADGGADQSAADAGAGDTAIA